MSLVTGLGVHIKVSSVAKSRSFYEGFLELKPVFAYGDAKFLKTVPVGVPTSLERYSGITYEIPGGAKIEIADGHIAVKEAEVFTNKIESPKVSAMINVTSLVPLLKKPIDKKLKVTHYYWGTLEAVVRDPDGWVVVLIAPYSEKEHAAISKIVSVQQVKANS